MGAKDEATPKLHIDSDWKANAQAEKQRLSEKEQAKTTASSARDQQGLPQANLTTLADLLASQAIMGLGAYSDPKTNRVIIDLHGAKLSIDLLQVLEDKTKGQATADETKHVQQLLVELRSRFVQIVQLLAQQQGAGGAPMEAEGASLESGPGSPLRA